MVFIRLFLCDCVMINVPHRFLVSIIHRVYCRHIQWTMLAITVCSTTFVFAVLRPMSCYCAHRNAHLNPGEMHLQPESILNLTIKARCILQFIGSCVFLLYFYGFCVFKKYFFFAKISVCSKLYLFV